MLLARNAGGGYGAAGTALLAALPVRIARLTGARSMEVEGGRRGASGGVAGERGARDIASFNPACRMSAASSGFSPAAGAVPAPASVRPMHRALAVFEGVFGVVGALALAVLVPLYSNEPFAADVLVGIALALAGAWLGWRLWHGRAGSLGAMLVYLLIQVPHAAWGGAMWKFVLGPYYVLRWHAGGGHGSSRGIGIQFDFSPPPGEAPWVGVNVVALALAVLAAGVWLRGRRASRAMPG